MIPDVVGLQTRLIVYGIVLAVMAGGLFACYRWAYNRGAEHERAVYEAKLQDAALEFARQLEEQQRVIERQAQEIQDARRLAGRYREDLEGALANDPESRDWGTTLVPGPVRLQLEAASRPGLPEDPRRAD